MFTLEMADVDTAVGSIENRGEGRIDNVFVPAFYLFVSI